ncbi:MAG: hypothetical protein DIU79_12335 [Actinobacteria bacterium]|nr:MAG: hypothetical protein DIU79_12335 [Actinomycetota bacterium]
MYSPRSIPGWTVAGFGATALVLGAIGLAFPEALLAVLGFETLPAASRASGDYTRVFLASSAVASLNMGVYYLVAAVTDWRPFFAFSVVFRMVTCVVFTALVVADVAPARFLAVALWEGVGGVVTAAAIWYERRRAAVGQVATADSGH